MDSSIKRARDRLHFVVLVEFQRVEVALVAALHGVQLVARGHAADVDRILQFEQALLDGAVAFDEFPRMRRRGFQFLFELADLDGELAHHAHQVVEQLRGHARHGARFGTRRGQRPWPGQVLHPAPRWQAAGSAPSAEKLLSRAASSISMTRERVVGRRVFARHGGDHLREAVGRGHEGAGAVRGRRDRVGFADLQHVFETMRELGDAADAEDIRRALERVRGALGIAAAGRPGAAVEAIQP